MKLTAIHDSQGNILTLIACPAQSPQLQLQLRPGHRVTEVEAEGLTVDGDLQRAGGRLSDVMQTHRVDVGRAALTKR